MANGTTSGPLPNKDASLCAFGKMMTVFQCLMTQTKGSSMPARKVGVDGNTAIDNFHQLLRVPVASWDHQESCLARDRRCQNYSDNGRVQSRWREIDQKLNVDSMQCQHGLKTGSIDEDLLPNRRRRWRYVRDGVSKGQSTKGVNGDTLQVPAYGDRFKDVWKITPRLWQKTLPSERCYVKLGKTCRGHR